VPLAPLFPGGEKKPAVSNYLKMGARATSKLAAQLQFAKANAFGFRTGRPSDVTVMDVDVADENVFADRCAKHGQPKIAVRSSISGKYHAYYAYNGELRLIRPWKSGSAFDRVDILGDGGIVVAPPSQFETGGGYEIIHGHLDDLDRLKPLQNIDDIFWSKIAKGELPDGVYDSVDYEDYELAVLAPKWAPHGTRNRKLWEHCMRRALHCTKFEQLVTEAEKYYTMSCEQQPHISDSELVKIARSAWKYTIEGRNWFGGQHGVAFTEDELATLLTSDRQDVYVLLTRMKWKFGPHSTFWLANGWHEELGWSRKRYTAARNYLVGTYIMQIRPPAPNRSALYRWINRRRQPRH
jgi:hypothetical protein